jgi:hypothetical protein
MNRASLSAACVRECLAQLGLPPDASPTEIRAAFHKLVFEHHPDRVASAQHTARLIRVVRAYRTLRSLDARLSPAVIRRCTHCGLLAPCEGETDVSALCADCLLSRSAPPAGAESLRHTGVLGAYAVSVLMAILFLATDHLGFGLMSLACTATGLGCLAATCVRVNHALP